MLFNSREHRKEVLEEMKIVRDSGETNMADPHGVQEVAYKRELYTLVTYLGSNPSGRGSDRYFRLLKEFEKYLDED